MIDAWLNVNIASLSLTVISHFHPFCYLHPYIPPSLPPSLLPIGLVLIDISLRMLHKKKQSAFIAPFVSAIQYVLRETQLGSYFFKQVPYLPTPPYPILPYSTIPYPLVLLHHLPHRHWYPFFFPLHRTQDGVCLCCLYTLAAVLYILYVFQHLIVNLRGVDTSSSSYLTFPSEKGSRSFLLLLLLQLL